MDQVFSLKNKTLKKYWKMSKNTGKLLKTILAEKKAWKYNPAIKLLQKHRSRKGILH